MKGQKWEYKLNNNLIHNKIIILEIRSPKYLKDLRNKNNIVKIIHKQQEFKQHKEKSIQ